MPDTVTYPGSDYYELAVRDYSEKLHSDLPATRLRGYVQLNLGTDASGRNTVRPAAIHYWGPLIRARRGRPVRVKFVNQLPPGKAGDLFLPVDTTTTGAGTGPDGRRRGLPDQPGVPAPARRAHAVDQRRHAVPVDHRPPARRARTARARHWSTCPTCGSTRQGRSVPEGTPGATNDPGPGATTLYFPNAQSARLLYLHDDTYGQTRLNVYAGEAAPYIIGDEVEDELVGGNTASRPGAGPSRRGGPAPAAELPLIIEDKTFVPDDGAPARHRPDLGRRRVGRRSARSGTRTSTCPTRTAMREQGRVSDQAIINAKGRWDYLPWYWKGYKGTVNGPVPNPLFGTVPSQPEEIPGTPNLSAVPNAFHDTMLVNGTAYPYVRVGAQGLPAAHPQRLRRPAAQPAAVLRPVRRDRGDRAGRLARAADRLGRGAACCRRSRR